MIDKRKIYAVQVPGMSSTLFALDVTMGYEGFQGISFYTPGERGHRFKGKIKKEMKDGFIFQCAGIFPGDWIFTEVTYENFKSKYYAEVYRGEDILLKVNNTKQLQDYYHQEFLGE